LSTQIQGLTSDQLRSFVSADYQALVGSYNAASVHSWISKNFAALSITSASHAVIGVALASATPIVLDLNGDGIQTTTLQQGVSFDVNNNGTVERTAWVARGDGLLVRDLNKDGIVNDGGELFGEGTVLADGTRAADGYVALRALDSNLDGVIDTSDSAFSQLMVWVDKNGDGVTDAGELSRLSDLGITSLSTSAQSSTQTNNGNLIGLLGSYTTADGQTHQMGDVWFQIDETGQKVFDLSAVAQAAGGKVSLNQAETLKVTLQDVLAVGAPDILSGTSQLTVTGDQTDTVQLSGSWSLAGTHADGADTYMVYVNQNAQLMVNDKIHTIIG